MNARASFAGALFTLLAAGCVESRSIVSVEGIRADVAQSFAVGAETREWSGSPLMEFDVGYAGGEVKVFAEAANGSRTLIGSVQTGWGSFAAQGSRTVLVAATLQANCDFRQWDHNGSGFMPFSYDREIYLDEYPDMSDFFALFDCYV